MRERTHSIALAVGKILPVILLASCASSPKKNVYSHIPLDLPTPEPTSKRWCEGWTRAMDANISHVIVSADASRVLVSTSGDHGKPKGMEGRLRLLDSRGVMKWSKWVKQPAKAQAIADDGSKVAFSNYEDKLFVLDPRGRPLWEKEHLGVPYIFKALNRLVLINDDDSDPLMAFVTYDLAGNKIGEARVEKLKEPEDIAVSKENARIAIAMRGGGWETRSIDGAVIARGSVDGQPASIALNSSKVVVLHSDPSSTGAQKFTAFDAESGSKSWSVSLENRKHEQVRIAGGTAFLYGNSTNGQSLVAIDLATGAKKWAKGIPEPATFASPVQALSKPVPHVALLLDRSAVDPAVEPGTLHLSGIDEAGKSIYEISVNAEDGVYSFSIDPNAAFAVAGTGKPGDGILRTYSPCKE